MNRGSKRNSFVKSESSHNWHLIVSLIILLFSAFKVIDYHVQHTVVSNPVIPLPNTPKKIEPAQTSELFSIMFYTYIDSALMEYGFTTEFIAKKQNVIDDLIIKIPTDLPITQVNLAVTLAAQDLGGEVLYAVEDENNNNVKMHIGFQGTHTTTVNLQEYSKKRSTAMISVIIDSIKIVNEVISRICKIQQPLILSLVSESSSMRNSLKHCGHTIQLQSSRLDSFKSIAIKVDQIDDRKTIEKKLWDIENQAKHISPITVVAHPRVNTLLALEAVLPRLERRGHQFTTNLAKDR
tara:strand:- start:683 stop:1564 length:882 start_codon:yes stop_codon:yes gene_type:complete